LHATANRHRLPQTGRVYPAPGIQAGTVHSKPPSHTDLIEEIEKEHSFLRVELNRLREAMACRLCHGEDCAHCEPGAVRRCQQAVDTHFSTLLSYMHDHFMHEESAMPRHGHGISPALRDTFRQHTEAHADMMAWAAKAVGAVDPCLQGQSMLNLIEDWLNKHIATYDDVLLAWLRQH
jgi:hemerythrin